MAAATEKNSKFLHIPGLEGRLIERVSFKFNSTDATSTINTKLRHVENVFLTWGAAPAARPEAR